MRDTSIDIPLWTFAAMACAFIALLLSSPMLAGMLVLALTGLALFLKPMGRLAIFTLGGLFALGGDSGLGVTKLAYMGATVFLFVIAAWRLRGGKDGVFRDQVRVAWLAFYSVLVAIGIAVLVGLASGNGIVLVGQDAFTYWLLGIAPLIGLDASKGSKAGSLHVLVVALSVSATLGWAIWWLGLRGNQLGSLVQVALPTSFLGFALFSVTGAFALLSFKGWHRWLWGLLSVSIPLIYIASGSRSMVVFLLGVLAFLGAKRVGRVPITGWLGTLAVMGVLIVGLLPTMLELLPDGQRIGDRFLRTSVLLESNDLSADGSYVERARAYAVTARGFLQAPFVGLGFGHLYPPVDGHGPGDLKLDSPLLVLSKFGILGFVFLLVYLVCIWRLAVLRRGPGQYRVGATLFWSFIFIGLGRLWFVAPPEDKGASYGVAVIVCVASMSPLIFARTKAVGRGVAKLASPIKRTDTLVRNDYFMSKH